eukprot:CAMPEP_0197173288 /NCGR_PEP_ID=MMETSP1423-20130617/277_1 /TAXON_ID=476441 /ORGANISM="Pseudo-nitzschia heimii, Strain UNC1101" /LENGTH=331 /DNA_ID=CAMNT_0042622083 /DNA_START=62 /DNA_END=1057 /DNA_ORIENTATION=-
MTPPTTNPPDSVAVTATAAAAATTPKLQMLNYVNVLAYGSYFAASYGCSRAGLPDNGELSDKYQTLITPAPYAFAIWGIIFTAELVWTIAQLTPTYRSHPLVVKGVGYGFAQACVAQAAWTVAFSLERIALSVVAMHLILIPLVRIVRETKNLPATTTTTTTGGYWLLKFPFQIHASWILCATFLNANLLLVASGVSVPFQTVFGAASLFFLFLAGTGAILAPHDDEEEKPHNRNNKVWTVPCVVAWASFAIARELSDPREKIKEAFPEATISRTETAASAAGYLLVLIVTLVLLRDRCYPADDDDDDDDNVLDSDGESEERNNHGYSSLN